MRPQQTCNRAYSRAYRAARPLVYEAHVAVRKAIRAGDLPRPDGLKCEDCGSAAHAYDHRDYTRPLEVEPVCRGCNRKRGPGHPYVEAPSGVGSRAAFRDLLKGYPRGTTAKIAAACGVSWAAVWQWGVVPPERALAVERITGISRHDLRPDIFGEAPGSTAPSEAA